MYQTIRQQTNKTDSDLLTEFCQGEVEAFNRLVQRWERRIYSFILRYVGDPDEALDLCQQTFIKAYYKVHELRDREKFSTWLYQIAVNACRNTVKRKQRYPTVSLERSEEWAPASGVAALAVEPGSHPDALLDARSVRDRVRQALQRIPPEQRAVIIMKEYQGMRFQEIAAVLGIPLGTVKSRMYYGLGALRRIFQTWNLDAEAL
ncbi:MAG: sigma-70 family RNA polymerase sigma factor [Candidatus Latescibacterota bacterium]